MNNPALDIRKLSDQIRDIAYAIHVYHGHGHLENVYENALVHRLRKAGLEVKQQCPVQVFDEDGTCIGDYVTDLIVDGRIIVELKTVRALAPEHEAQILGYLKSTGLEHGVLINFGSYKFQIRKFARSEKRGRAAGALASVISALFAFFAAKLPFSEVRRRAHVISTRMRSSSRPCTIVPDHT